MCLLFSYGYCLLKVPSVIDDTGSYLAIGRDTASTCENIDVKNCIEKSQMPSINEECTSIVSEDLTDAMMLNYILNQANRGSLDSGRGKSLPYLTESPESAKIDLSYYFDDTDQPQDAEEMSAGNIENNQILPQVHHNNASRETISQMATCSGVSHPLHDHEPVQTFVNTETPSGAVKASTSDDFDSVLKQDFLTTPQMDSNSSNPIKHSKAAETACTLPCASNVLNANLQNFMHQQSSKHTKGDSNVIIAPLEVVNNDDSASQNLITKFHDNIQKVAQISTKSSFVAEPTIMPGAYVYYDVESDKKVSTPESHSPTLLDQVFTETENEDISCVTTGTYVDSDAALQQDVVSTCEVDKLSLDLHFCSSFQEHVSAAASSNVIHEMTTSVGDTGIEHIATSTTCNFPLPDNKS